MSELTLNEAKKLAEAQQAQELLDRAAAGESASVSSLSSGEMDRVRDVRKLLEDIRSRVPSRRKLKSLIPEGWSPLHEGRRQQARIAESASQQARSEPSWDMFEIRERVLRRLAESAAARESTRFGGEGLVPERGVPRQRKVRLPDGRLVPYKEPTPARVAAKARRAERVYERSLPRFDRFAYRFIDKGGYKQGLAGLAALVGGALIGKALAPVGKTRSQSQVNEEFRQSQLEQKARGDMLDMMGRQEYKASLQDSINQNLARLQSEAPDIYLRMSAGRVLPQGAIVIGGAPRTDLLNQLGLAMANGQFGQ